MNSAEHSAITNSVGATHVILLGTYAFNYRFSALNFLSSFATRLSLARFTKNAFRI